MQSDTTSLFLMVSLSSEIVNMGNSWIQKHLDDNSLIVSYSSLSCYWKKEAAAKASRKNWPSNRIRHQPWAQGPRSSSVTQQAVIWYSGGPRSVKRQNHLIKEEIKFRGGSTKKTLASVAASLAEEFLSLTTCFLGDHKVLSWLQCVVYLQII